MSYWSRSFPGAAECLAEVRHFTQMVLGDAPGADLVVLAVSELAGNAIVHTASGEPGGQFVVHLAAFSDRWQVRVDDEGSPSDPRIVVADLGEDNDAAWVAEAGRGLAMVAAISQKWGVIGDSRARAVWAEIPCPVQCTDAVETAKSGDMLDALEAAAEALAVEDEGDDDFDASGEDRTPRAGTERDGDQPKAAGVTGTGDAIGDAEGSTTPADAALAPPGLPATHWPGRVPTDPKIAERHRRATHSAMFMRALIENAYAETIGPRPLPYWPPFPHPHARRGAQAGRADRADRAGHRHREVEEQEAG